MQNSPIYVAATGMISALGPDTATTHAAVAAGVSACGNSVHYNNKFHPMRMALIPEKSLPPLNPVLETAGLSFRQQRLLQIATPALIETLSQLPLAQPPALFLALPESIPGCAFVPHPNFLGALEIQSGITFNKVESKIFNSGRAGGIEAIHAAMNYLATSGEYIALVGGVDTHLDLLLLGVLDADQRILADNISDGFVPGEAGGFLLLINEQSTHYLPHNPKALIHLPGIAVEPGHRYSDQPYRGEGLAQAWRQALEHCAGTSIHSIYSCLNGENFGAKEMGVAFTRNQNAFVGGCTVEHPADCFGDLGAAVAPILISLALKREPGFSALHSCSANHQLRTAVVTTNI